jgi:hypothetical protein
VPGKPTNLTAVSQSDGSIRLTWNAPAGGPYWYEIYMRDVRKHNFLN